MVLFPPRGQSLPVVDVCFICPVGRQHKEAKRYQRNAEHKRSERLIARLERKIDAIATKADEDKCEKAEHVWRSGVRPNVRANRRAEAGGVSPGCKNSLRTAARAYAACRSGSG